MHTVRRVASAVHEKAARSSVGVKTHICVLFLEFSFFFIHIGLAPVTR